MSTLVRFYTGSPYNVDSMTIVKWLSECQDRNNDNYSVQHYWRSTYTLVDFEYAEDALAFKLAFDLKWLPYRKVL